MLALKNNIVQHEVSSELIREKMIKIRKGESVVVSDQLLESLIVRSFRTNLSLEIVSIPNPSQVGTKDGLLAGYISAPEIELFRLREGLENPRQVELIHAISKISGQTLSEVYSFRESIPNKDDDVRIDALEKSLKNWEWRAGIVQMSDNIKELDLSNKDGLMRAIQLQMALERKRAAIKYCDKYYSQYPDVKEVELAKAEKAYKEDIVNPQMVCCGLVADAILQKNVKYLVDTFIQGIFTSCEKVFGMATGVKISRLSKANKEAALLEWSSK